MENKIKKMIQSKQWRLEDEEKYLKKEIECVKKCINSENLVEICHWLPVYAENIKKYYEKYETYAKEIDELEYLLNSSTDTE